MSIAGISSIVGMVVGLLIAVVIIKLCNKNGKFKTEYDERQEAIRGRGFKYGLYSAWVMLGIYMALEIGEVDLHMETAFVLFTILIISLMIQTSHAIWNDAYFGNNNATKKYAVTFIILTLLNLLLSIMFGRRHQIYVDGVITVKAVNLECALIFMIMGVEFVIKDLISRDDSEEE